MSLDDLALFESVVRTGGFTSAAREWGLSKSTVSDRISRLEGRLGVRLLHRTTRSVGPTADGAAYYDRCARIVAEAREADAALTRAREVPLGTLRVTCPRLFGHAFLGPVVADYLARYPDVAVELVLAERVVDLVEEGFDLALRVGTPEDGTLVVRRLGAAPMVYCASPTYLAARPAPCAPDDLASHALITVTRGEPARWPLRVDGVLRLVPVTGRLHVNSLTMAREAALCGTGIAFLPAFLCAEALAQGALVTVLDAHAPPPMPVNALYPSSRHLSAKVRAFVDRMVAHTRSARPWEVASG